MITAKLSGNHLLNWLQEMTTNKQVLQRVSIQTYSSAIDGLFKQQNVPLPKQYVDGAFLLSSNNKKSYKRAQRAGVEVVSNQKAAV